MAPAFMAAPCMACADGLDGALMAEAYPLTWPDGQPRTPSHMRKRSQFKVSQDTAQRFLRAEIQRLGGRNLIISTNIPIRQDGLPYADAARRIIRDNGVAVYFDYDGKPMCFACDKWETVRENIHAISKTIEALRGIERWGSGDMMEKAFRGYAALPPPMTPPKQKWWQVFGFSGPDVTFATIRAKYLDFVRQFHEGGATPDPDRMAMYNAAYDEAREEKGL